MDHVPVGMNEQHTESTTNVMDHTMDTVPTTTTTTTTTEGQSLYERFASAISYIDTEPDRAISTLLQIQEMVTMQSFFSTSSTSSETIDDISTSILPYLTLDHHLAMANVQIPVDRDRILTRQINLLRACDYFNAFLQKLEAYDILTKEEQVQYQMLVEMTDHINDNNNRVTNDGSATATTSSTTSSSPLQTLLLPPPMNRDAKITQYRQKQQLQQEQERLKSLQLRRRRLRATISEDEMMDGYDQESLIRTTNITAIYLTKMITYEEWSLLLQELPMISMMIQQQNDPLRSDDRYYHNDQGGYQPQQQQQHDTRQAPKPMELTQITKDSTTGQLRVHRQEIQSKTFRPGWNQPTMSLEALAEREVHGAVQRQQQQEQSEAHNKTQPRRYEQLVKDGMEDNADLVEASAILDRNWDTFKDDNPRGCGNKRGDVGDRNF